MWLRHLNPLLLTLGGAHALPQVASRQCRNMWFESLSGLRKSVSQSAVVHVQEEFFSQLHSGVPWIGPARLPRGFFAKPFEAP